MAELRSDPHSRQERSEAFLSKNQSASHRSQKCAVDSAPISSSRRKCRSFGRWTAFTSFITISILAFKAPSGFPRWAPFLGSTWGLHKTFEVEHVFACAFSGIPFGGFAGFADLPSVAGG